MNFDRFLSQWDNLKAENRWHRLILIAVLGLCLLLTIRLFYQKTIVILQPVPLSQEAWITQDKASQSYQEAWGLFLAELLGNVTPSTVGFIQDRLKPLFHYTVYSLCHLRYSNDQQLIHYLSKFFSTG